PTWTCASTTTPIPSPSCAGCTASPNASCCRSWRPCRRASTPPAGSNGCWTRTTTLRVDLGAAAVPTPAGTATTPRATGERLGTLEERRGLLADAGLDPADAVQVGVERPGGLLRPPLLQQVEQQEVLAGLADHPGAVVLVPVLDQPAHPVLPAHRVQQHRVVRAAHQHLVEVRPGLEEGAPRGGEHPAAQQRLLALAVDRERRGVHGEPRLQQGRRLHDHPEPVAVVVALDGGERPLELPPPSEPAPDQVLALQAGQG